MGFGDWMDGMETTELSTNGGSKQLHLAKVQILYNCYFNPIEQKLCILHTVDLDLNF